MRYMTVKTIRDDRALALESYLSNHRYHWSSQATNGGRRFEITSRDDVGPLDEDRCEALAMEISGQVETY